MLRRSRVHSQNDVNPKRPVGTTSYEADTISLGSGIAHTDAPCLGGSPARQTNFAEAAASTSAPAEQSLYKLSSKELSGTHHLIFPQATASCSSRRSSSRVSQTTAVFFLGGISDDAKFSTLDGGVASSQSRMNVAEPNPSNASMQQGITNL